jgi:GT2 family glycosyltransferase
LNPDTYPEPDTLMALVQRLGKGTCDAVGCSLRLPDGTIQSHGGLWHAWLARPVSIGKGAALSTPVDPAFVERKQNYLNGASMLIGRSFLAKAGPMREDYFLYCEEVEWCLRGLSRGVKLGFALTKPMMHYQGTTTGASVMSRTAIYLDMRNKILLTRDLYPWRLPIAALFALFLHLIRYVRQRAWPQIGYGLAGFVAGVLNKRGVPVWLKA